MLHRGEMIAILVLLVLTIGWPVAGQALVDGASLGAYWSARTRTQASPADRELWVIGDDPPDETVVIDGDQRHGGDILVAGQGSLIVQGPAGHLRVAGTIQVVNQGTFRVDGGALTLEQDFRYQYGYSAGEQGLIELLDASLSYHGQPCNGAVAGQGRLVFRDTVADTIVTTMLLEDAELEVTRSSRSIEAILTQGCRAELTDSDGSVVWIGFEEGEVADFAFPDTSGPVDWEFSSDLPGVTGVDYRLTMTNCTDFILGLISWEGSDITVRDSDLRVCGVVMEGAEPQVLSGVVNGLTYPDSTFPLTDRTLRMVNTTVLTWNLYTFAEQALTLTGSVLGEVLTFDSSSCHLEHCLVDGSGGYLGCEASSQLISLYSTATADLMVRDQGVLVALHTGHQLGQLVLAEQGTALLYNCALWRPPELADESVAFWMELIEPEGMTPLEGDVPVIGTARLLHGPDTAPVFQEYHLDQADDPEPAEWLALGELHPDQVESGLLETWDTRGLPAGPRYLRLTIQAEGMDPVSVVKGVQLAEIPTYTPEPSPETPTPTPEPTATHPYGVRLELPARVSPGDDFRVTGRLDNPGAPREQVPVVFALEAGGEFWFWPSWSRYAPPEFEGFDYRRTDLPTGSTVETVIPLLTWPETGQQSMMDLWFYSALLTPDLAGVDGVMAAESWGFGPS